MNKNYIEICEREGWNVSLDPFEEESVELQQHSPAGEDFSFTVDSTDFVESIREYARDFDPEEHAEMWIPHRGRNGVPYSIQDLLDDANDIKEMLKNLSDSLLEADFPA